MNGDRTEPEPAPVAPGPPATAEDAAAGEVEPDYAGPFAVGRYARELQGFLRGRERVRLIGEVANFSGIRGAGVYFELRDGDGAIPCAVWRNVYDKLELPEGALRDGVEVVIAGHLDYFPGSATSSPRFNFRVTYLRPAGEGDLLAQLDRLRKQLAGEGLFEPQKRLPRPVLPRTIGVITGAESAARADILAGLARRSWNGDVVFAHPPVQGVGAAPKIAAALSALAAVAEVETIIVARGGGSLIDLWCFCDESLCRTVSLLRVPVIAAVGHETDRTLIDDVAAVSCSTPTHACEAAVRVDLAVERRRLPLSARALDRAGGRSVSSRARVLVATARVLSQQADAERSRLHQMTREIRAAAARTLARAHADIARGALVLSRRRSATLLALAEHRLGSRRIAGRLAAQTTAIPARHAAGLERLVATLTAHDPERVLERGYAIVTGYEGEVVTTAAAARERGRFRVRFADDDVGAEVTDDE